jgi:hypothetical protein
VFYVLQKNVNHGGRQGNAVQALDRWRHPVASCEARDVPCIVGCLIRMVTKTTSVGVALIKMYFIKWSQNLF